MADITARLRSADGRFAYCGEQTLVGAPLQRHVPDAAPGNFVVNGAAHASALTTASTEMRWLND
jgi:hypothetical protein